MLFDSRRLVQNNRPTDGSKPSMYAIDYTISMATKQGGFELMIMTVVRMSVSSYGLMTPESEVRYGKDREIREARQLLDEVENRLQTAVLSLRRKLLIPNCRLRQQ
jgi:hypothetical protein